MSHSTYIPPPAVADNARRGLELRATFKRGGTAVGMALGQALAKREPVPPSGIRRMYAYFARHEVDKKGKHFDDPVRPSNGYIAWQLWGGDEGREWVTNIRKDLLLHLHS